MIPDDFKRKVLEANDIVDVISGFGIELKKAGKGEYKAPCCFHSEKTPSFTANQTEQFYYCFGCMRGGNAIDFIMDYRGYGFRAAVAELAGMVGMKLPEEAKGKTDVWKVKLDRDNAEARRLLQAAEPEVYIGAIGIADAIAGRPISEQDKTRLYQALQIFMRCIEGSKRRRLTEAERRHILGAEFPEHLEELQQKEAA